MSRLRRSLAWLVLLLVGPHLMMAATVDCTYVELITRSATRHLDPDDGDEAAALSSIHKLFDLTRETIKRNGRYCTEFTKIAVVVLNQKVRPFAARWHPRVNAGSMPEIDPNVAVALIARLSGIIGRFSFHKKHYRITYGASPRSSRTRLQKPTFRPCWLSSLVTNSSCVSNPA